jgi:hypothetical protein
MEFFFKSISEILLGLGIGKLISIVKIFIVRLITRRKISKQAKDIAQAFDEYSNQFLRQTLYTIPGIGHIKREEVNEILNIWENGISGVLLTGTAGSGKSGLVLDLANKLHEGGHPILFIRATDFEKNDDPISALEQMLPIEEKLVTSFSILGKELECFVIIDQVDSISESVSIYGFINFLNTICKFERIRVLAISRTYEAQNNQHIQNLGFSRIESIEIDSETAKKYLSKIGLSDPSNDLIELSRNLLNLSLIAELVLSEKNVLDIIGTVQLWGKYILSIKERDGEKTFISGMQLADRCQIQRERNFSLNWQELSTTSKLNSRGVIVKIPNSLRYHFRHDQLQTFFCAYYHFLDFPKPEGVVSRYGKYNSKDVLLWLCKLYGINDPKNEAEFVKKIFEDEETIPYYTKKSVLDYYAHLENLSKNHDTALVILDAIKKQNNLRISFFGSKPSAAWAKLLWDHDFLSIPPEPKKDGEGRLFYQGWDVQYYLISVGMKVPDIVVNHVKSIKAYSWYLGYAIEALCNTPIEYVEKVVPIIKNWFLEPNHSDNLKRNTLKLIGILVKNKKVDLALELFEALTAPIGNLQSNGYHFNRELFGYKAERSTVFDLLKKQQPLRVLEILERHLIRSVYGNILPTEETSRIEARWSRSAIEDTNQDRLDEYQDGILRGLRDTLIDLVTNHEGKVIIEKYLNGNLPIFRRLGLYIIGQTPRIFRETMAKELLNAKNYDNFEIHHEFFTLLNWGYPYLNAEEQDSLIRIILAGPDAERLVKSYDRVDKSWFPSLEKFISDNKDYWIRDRLWMIREYLDKDTADLLENLVKQYKEPEHPEFSSYMSDVQQVIEVSPYAFDYLQGLSPKELLNLIKTWKPDSTKGFVPERISYGGLANEISKVVINDPEKYKPNLLDICLIRPEYTLAIINYWSNPDIRNSVPWSTVITLFTDILKEKMVWNNDSQQGFYGDIWRSVRLAIANLLKNYFMNNENAIPFEYLESAQNLIFQLLEDPDPTFEADRPSEGSFGHNDPSTVALNHVRPIALHTLIRSAIHFANHEYPDENSEVNERCLQAIVKEKLATKLDKNNESSWAIRSVFGQLSPTLFWLDQKWFIDHIEAIFPSDLDEETRWLFVSAWNAYIHGKYYSSIFKIIRPKYILAIQNLTEGFSTESEEDQAFYLAIHLLFEYLFSEENPEDFLLQEALLNLFFKNLNPKIRCKAPKALASICKSNPERLQEFWPKAKILWEWRNQESINSNHSADFDDELQNFAQLLEIAKTETMVSMGFLLTNLLPHFRNVDNHNMGWRAIEEFLAREVTIYPVEVICYYKQLCMQKSPSPGWVFHSDDTKIIIQTACENNLSCEEALGLIDFFARQWNDYSFKHLFQKYAG